MLSRNNTKFHLQRMEPQKQHFTIKKFSVGVASVLVSCTFAAYSNANLTARADENATTDETAEVISNTANDSNVVTLSGNSAGANSETPASSTPSSAPASAGTQSTENTTTTKTAAPAASSTANTQAQTATTVEPSSETNENSSSAGTQASEAATSEATTNFENATSEANNNINNAENTTSLATASANEAATSQASSTTAPTSTPSNEALTTNSVAPADETTQSFGESALTALAADTPVAVAETTNETTVSSWADLVSAMANSNYNIINVNGALTATSNNSIGSNGHTVTVKGADGASINFGNYSLTATGGSWNVTFDNLAVTTGVGTGVIDLNATTGTNTVTFKDVTATGTSLYGGGGTTNVIIDGTTTSTVDNASTGKANTYSATSREANIHSANSVTIADGATFTLNRSSIGDGINLPDGSTVKVGDNATFTVNMNTNNATDSARYHNAGIFMEQGGSFITGRDSVVTMNTSIGQAVSIGVKRPADSYTDTDRWGGYTENPTRYDGPTVVTFGENSTFNFTGRDGFMLGDNATFTSGEYSTVHFQNKGRGVALDLGDDSNIIISKHSNTLFESDGKGPNSSTATPSGGYSAYNYIGVDENSNILIDEYATFRVILTNRGDNDWDDVISLNSQKTASVVSFTSKQGAVVDIRDDNTNFYAELISFPLGTPTATIDIEDPLYLNLQRYSAGGETTGWMPVGGTNINATSNKYTANLVYIGGTNGKVKIGGTDYVVYQQIKSDGTQQIWLNVNEVEFAKNGFQSLPIYDNGANEDVSISGTDLVSGIYANAIKDNQTDPTVNVSSALYKDAPYYGISTMRASHQIWFPHSTVNEAAGQHTNTIKYIYEDGTTAAPTVTQEVNMVRDLTLSLSAETIADIQTYAATHTADEILDYIKEKYEVTADTGWKVNNAVNTTTAYDAVTTPTIEGYTASIQSTNANGVSTSDASSVHAILSIPETIVENGQLTDAYKNNGTTGIPENYVTVVVYKKTQTQQTATITYVDSTTGNTLTVDTVTGDSNATIDYSTADKIKALEDQGYVLVTDGFPSGAVFDDDTSVDQSYTVTLKHDTATSTPDKPATPGDPINPNDPDGPKWPTEAGEVSKDVTLTVTYSGAGEKTPANNVQTATWNRTVTVDKVTGEVVSSTDWTPDKTTYNAVTTPVVEGYYADTAEVTAQTVTQEDITIPVVYKPLGMIIPVDPSGNPIPGTKTPQYNNDPDDPTKGGATPVPDVPGYTPQVPSVTPEKPGEDTPVIYVPVTPGTQQATITYIDQTTGEPITIDRTQGASNTPIDYTTADKIKELTDKGYILVSDEFPSDATFDDDDQVDQNFNVTLKHDTATSTPDKPATPGEPINPNDPNGPKWPTEAAEVTKDVTLTVHYVGAGENTPADNVQQATWQREVMVDKVTGEVVSSTDWTPSQTAYSAVTTPIITGYYADISVVPSQTVTQNNIEVTVTYKPLGHIIPVDPAGNPLPEVPTPSYENDPNDPTKGGTTPVPDIPGYHPATPSVTPDKPGEDTPVVYVKDEPQKATITYIDQNTGDPITIDTVTGDPNTPINYTTADKIKELTDKGYVLVTDEFPSNATFDGDNNVDQNFNVTLKHDTTTSTPDKPATPGEPINPNDPNGPKWPSEAGEVTKDVTLTVHYVGAGENTPADNVQQATWQREVTVDKVTGEVLSATDWTPNKTSYDSVTTPVITGYYADIAVVPNQAVSQDNIELTVTYKPLGHIIPVDPAGDPLPEAPTPSYENDPNDPTKGGETPVPDIPGYTPQQPTVDPEDPGKDTPVTYVPVPKDQTAKIVYVDAKTGETIQTDTTTGKSGERIDYTTADKIQDFINKGYVLVEDGFKAAGDPTYDDDESQDQTFIIKLNHAVAPVGPNDPHEPGTPINPDDPNSPLWPNLDQYNKQYTSTVHFVDENGNKLRDDVVQTSTWTRNLLIDKVTGEILNPDEPWTPDKENYAEVNVPVINGYYADKAVVPGDPTQQKDLETSVTYKKIGVIVPVDENGVPIPGAPTPQYKNDPNDPTKVIVTTTPDVPGYSATIGSVDPIDPGANTPVIYKKDTTSTPEPQNSTPTTPTAKTVATEPQATTPVTQTQTTTQKQAVKATTATELPQTGDEEDTTQTLLGVTLLAGLAGLVGFGKKRKTKS